MTTFQRNIEELVYLADQFDRAGFYRQANKLDRIIRSLTRQSASAWVGYKPLHLKVKKTDSTSFTEYLEHAMSYPVMKHAKRLTSSGDITDQNEPEYGEAHKDAVGKIQKDIESWIGTMEEESKYISSLGKAGSLDEMAQQKGMTREKFAEELMAQFGLAIDKNDPSKMDASSISQAVSLRNGLINYLKRKSDEFYSTEAMPAKASDINIRGMNPKSPKAKLFQFWFLYNNTIQKGRGTGGEQENPFGHIGDAPDARDMKQRDIAEVGPKRPDRPTNIHNVHKKQPGAPPVSDRGGKRPTSS